MCNKKRACLTAASKLMKLSAAAAAMSAIAYSAVQSVNNKKINKRMLAEYGLLCASSYYLANAYEEREKQLHQRQKLQETKTEA